MVIEFGVALGGFVKVVTDNGEPTPWPATRVGDARGGVGRTVVHRFSSPLPPSPSLRAQYVSITALKSLNS